MAASTSCSLLSLPSSPHRARALPASGFLCPDPCFSRLKRSPARWNRSLATRCTPRLAPVAAAQSGWIKVLRTAWRVGKDGIETGTNMLPDAIPKPIARILVAAIGTSIVLFLLKSFLSTAFFVLAMMGAIYFAYRAFNTDESSKGSGSTTSTTTSEEETLEEARRIMEKYK